MFRGYFDMYKLWFTIIRHEWTENGALVRCTQNPIAAISAFVFVLTRFEE